MLYMLVKNMIENNLRVSRILMPLMISEDGSVFGWGQNKKGQVGHIVDGDGMVSKTVTHPVQCE